MIDNEASLCTHCSHYQKSYKNHLKYGTAIIGLLIALMTGISIIYKNSKEYFSDKKEVEVISARINSHKNFDINIINHNRKPALLTYIHMEIDYKKNNITFFGRPISEKLDAEDITNINKNEFDKKDKHLFRVADSSDSEYEYNYEKIMNTLVSDKNYEKCILISLLSMTNPEEEVFGLLKHNKIKGINVKAGYSYIIAGDSKQKYREIPVRPILYVKSEDTCLNEYAKKI